jgi:hypothetical protein
MDPTRKAHQLCGSLFCMHLWVLAAQPSVKDAKRSRKDVVVYLTMGPTSDSSHSRETKPVPN